ncbi:hypothetical protein [Vreelandella profundi]|uniref:hypothetical protein n=1 Tax=Vreelandella profundi TaxID=2852117 RepID=UPI001F20F93E|nr:hypothetical protein [Halomonas profundi]
MSEKLMQTKTLFISAGHSDSDPGAVGNGHTEAGIIDASRRPALRAAAGAASPEPAGPGAFFNDSQHVGGPVVLHSCILRRAQE